MSSRNAPPPSHRKPPPPAGLRRSSERANTPPGAGAQNGSPKLPPPPGRPTPPPVQHEPSIELDAELLELEELASPASRTAPGVAVDAGAAQVQPPRQQPSTTGRVATQPPAAGAADTLLSIPASGLVPAGPLTTTLSRKINVQQPGSQTVAVPGRAAVQPSRTLFETFADEARQSIAQYERELQDEVDPLRIGRLHYEIARVHEATWGGSAETGEPVQSEALTQAREHYMRSLEAAPESLPTIVGARRVLLLRGEWEAVLALFDREVDLTPEPERRAALLLAKGRVLEDRLGRSAEAAVAYGKAVELTGADLLALKALEQVDLDAQRWDELAEVVAKQANAVTNDASLRAMLMARRARILELHQKDSETAAQLYQAALDVDTTAPGILEALKRLHYDGKRWRDLVRVLEREAKLVQDPAAKALALYRTGIITAERLQNRGEAIAALEAASQHQPSQAILETLVRLYEAAQEPGKAAKTLHRLIEVTREPQERLGYLQRVGEICRDELDDEEGAIAAFQAAVSIDPTYIPSLRALAPLYTAKERWDALVALLEGEATRATNSKRRAAAHCRAGVVLERQDRLSDAVSHYEHALSLEPNDATAFRALVRLHEAAGEHHKLVELYERAIESLVASGDVERKIEYLFAIGDLHRGPLHDYEAAEHAYRRVLRLQPGHRAALHSLQRVAEQAGHWRMLVEALDEEATLIDDEREVVALAHRAGEVLLERLKDPAEAIIRFRRVLDIEPNHRATLATLGRVYHDEGRWPDLVDIYARELEAEPQGPEAVALLHKIGDVCARYLLDRPRAIQYYRQAIAIDPSYTPSLHALRRLLEEQNEWESLLELIELERKNARDPQAQALASVRAGEIYEHHCGDMRAAERAYAAAAAAHPKCRPALDALGRAHAHLEHWESLARLLAQEAETAPDVRTAVNALTRAGDIWMDHLGKYDFALACYENVLARDPANLAAMLRLEVIYRQTDKPEALAVLLRKQVEALHDPGAKAAALSEYARLVELHGLGVGDTLLDCFSSILAARPRDWTALHGLERRALATNDSSVIASVDARLAAAASEPSLRAAYLTRQAEHLERAGQPQALQIYQQVLELDPQNRAALRGLRRVAEVLGDGPSLYEAACLEAGVVRDPEGIAEAWMRAGDVALEQLADNERAIAAYGKALIAWPDHERAAEAYATLLERQGDIELLVERLARAASEAKDPARRSELAIRCAHLQAQRLHNLGAALAVLQRLIDAQPYDARAWVEQGLLLLGDRRNEEAAAAFTRCLALKPDEATAAEAHRRLGQVSEATGDKKLALDHYQQALALDPSNPKLLEKLVGLQLDADQPQSAAEVAGRLVQLARTDAERIDALGKLARASVKTGDKAAALEAIAQTIALGGKASAADDIIDGADGWRIYAAALQRQLEQRTDAPAALYLEIARAYADGLKEPNEATRVLVRAIGELGGQPQLRLELGNRLLASGRTLEATEQFQYLLVDDASRVEAWRHLGDAYGQMQRPRERDMALAALTVLEQATPAELEQVQRMGSHWDRLGAGALAPNVVTELAISADRQAPVADLLASMADALVKLRPGDLARYGVTAKDRIGARSDHPLRPLADRLALVFGVEDYDLYLHRDPRRMVVEHVGKPSLMLPLWVTGLSLTQQVFAISTLMYQLARGVDTIEIFTVRELEVLLAAAARTMVPGFGEHVAPADTLEAQQKLITRALPRKRRKWFEAAGENYARAASLDVATFVEWSRQTARRVALIAADDLVGAMSVLDNLDAPGAAQGRAAAVHHPVRGDLLKVWMSRPAMLLRQRVGMLR